MGDSAKVSHGVETLHLPESCTLRLWGPPGASVIFKLWMGEDPTPISRICSHTFSPTEDDEGNAIPPQPFKVTNFCHFKQVWVRESNTVTVGFEILEMTMSRPFIPMPSQVPGSDAAPHGPPRKGAPPGSDHFETKPDTLSVKHFVESEVSMRDKLNSQMMAMKNKSVRRIEWKVENCSRLLEVSRPGEAVDSPVFSAAGVDRFQFHFYARGCEEGGAAGEHAQPCALYVSGPERITVRGVLHVGSHTRNFEHRYRHRGDVGGRSRFCNLQPMIDCNDVVTLALELVEVETDLPEQSGVLVLREARPGAGANSGNFGRSLDGSTGLSAAGGLSSVKGSLRAKRSDPSRTEEVVRCGSMPQLNQRQNFLPMVEKQQRQHLSR